MRNSLLILLLILLSLGHLTAQSSGVTGDTDINKCETKPYTISVQNNSGNPVTKLVITNSIANLTGFSYVPGTSSVNINGGGAFTTSDPSISGTTLTWNIDTLNGGALTLANGETINIVYSLTTDCNAVSGSQDVTVNYEVGGTPSSDSTNFSIQVLPGAITIKKTPNVYPQELGLDAEWELTVENTGLGTVKNVVITDVLGAGLQFKSADNSGANIGQTTTWSSVEVPQLAEMAPGETVTVKIVATVIRCTDLENVANARWGCDMSTDCFNTVSDGGKAQAAVQRIVKTPLIAYTPPDISFDYCENQKDVSFVISNTGDGIAHQVQTVVDFGGLTVSDVSSGATWNAAENKFTLDDSLAPGGNYTLSFKLNYSTWCGGTFPSGNLLWQKIYLDDCMNEFYPPVELSTINPPANSSSLAVTKTGAPAEIEIGGSITYNITSAFTGSINCGSGTTGMITVVDTLPDGFTVTDAGGGVYAPGTGGKGGTITWTFTPPATLNTNITIEVPGPADCSTACNTVFTNTVTATGTDCCGCVMNATASQTTAIECQELVTSNKTATPGTGLRCGNITYTNTYVFDDNAALDGVNINQMNFTERAENQQKYDGNLRVMFDGNDITASVGVTDSTPGGNLSLDFSGAGAVTVRNKTLEIRYDLNITENTLAACNSMTFYSWSDLNMGFNNGSDCLGDGIVHETTQVSVAPPAMTVSIADLGNIIHKCATQTIKVRVSQTSTSPADPKDVRLVLSGLNYYVVDPGTASWDVGGLSPVASTPVIDGNGDYIWTFNDVFAGNGQYAEVTLNVQKRCTGIGTLEATVYYDDNCKDDTTYDNSCSATGSATPGLLLGGDLLIEKNPEVYYASENQAQWKIYVTNRGTGTAYNVWVDDVLGAGLSYNSAIVDNMAGVTIDASLDHSGSAINGAVIKIDSLTAGERREITFTADVIDCNNLTNDVSASWGCVGIDCQVVVTDNSTVEIPDPVLVSTPLVTNPVEACQVPVGSIVIKNAGQTATYNHEITEELPEGLLYIPGTTRWRVNSGAWNGENAIYDPEVTGTTTKFLKWDKGRIPGLTKLDSGDKLEIEYKMSAFCPFNGGTVKLNIQYENPCGKVFNTSESRFATSMTEPQVTIVKTRSNSPINCKENIEWEIRVTNNSGYRLPIIWVEDILDGAYKYTGSDGEAPYTNDGGTNSGQVTTWELMDVPHGTTVTLKLRAETDEAPCSADLDNTVNAWWGCGTPDGSSATKPGTDAPDNLLCLNTLKKFEFVKTETRQPTMAYLNIGMSPSSIDSCKESTELTVVVQNTGPVGSKNNDLVVTLPTGLTYNAGTAQVGLGTDQASATASLGAVADPSISGSTLTFNDIGDKANNIADDIQADGGNDTLVLRFSVESACYITQNLAFSLRYYDCCDDRQYTTNYNQQLTALYPNLSVTKTPVSQQVACGTNGSWTIRVTNSGTGNAQVVRITDTPGSWIIPDYAASTTGLTDLGSGQYGWEINNLAGGASRDFTFAGTLTTGASPSDCNDARRTNSVSAVWACGSTGNAIDGNPTTTSDYDCTYSTPATAPDTKLLLPNLQATLITPVINCTGDGAYSGEITVRVENVGDGASTGQFTVQVSDGQGWIGTGTYNGTINAGNSVNVTIDTATWSPQCNTYNFAATVDLNSEICECNENDNTYTRPSAYDAPIPELVVTNIDFSGICGTDGINGIVRVTVSNTGAAAATGPFAVTLTTDNGALTYNAMNVASLAAGTSTTLNFTNIARWSDCSVTSAQFTATVDANNDVCECNGSNNTLQRTYTNDRPDLTITGIDTSGLTCTGDGISGTVAVTVSNEGNGGAANFRVTLSDAGGLTFSDQTVVSLNSGASTVVNFSAGGSWSDPSVCSVNLTANVDTTNQVCECRGDNNSATVSWEHLRPNLRVDSIDSNFSCTGDGTYTGIKVTVSNNGCASVSGAVVQLASNCGFTFTNQIVDLASGETKTLTFPFENDYSDCSCTFTATIDPSNAICETSSGDNSVTTPAGTLNMPDLEVTGDTLAINCVNDGEIELSGNINIRNSGCGDPVTANIPVQFTLYDRGGCTGNVIEQWTETLGSINIASGSTQSVAITARRVTTNYCENSNSGETSVRAVIDFGDTICEKDGSNNTYCQAINADTVDLTNTSMVASSTVATDGSVTGSITVRVTNSGGTAITNDFAVSVDDGQGWTSKMDFTALGGTLPLASGASVDLVFNWNRDFKVVPQVCSYSLSSLVDADNELCQCTTANDTSNTTHEPDLVNLRTVRITPVCDGPSKYTLEVEVENTGCKASAAFVLKMDDTHGNSQDINVAALNAGETRVITINPWPATCDPPNVTFTATTDSGNAVTETDESDNVTTQDFTNTAPDLVISEAVPVTEVESTGKVKGEFRIVVTNKGSAPVSSDFDIVVSDGAGWNSKSSFTSLGGTLPLDVSESVSLTIPWNREFNSQPYVCSYNNIKMYTEMAENRCECGETDNAIQLSHKVNLPALKVNSLVHLCEQDGKGTLRIEVENTGCSPLETDFDFILKESGKRSERLRYRSSGGKLPLNPGETSVIFVKDRALSSETGSTSFVVELDPDMKIDRLGSDDSSYSFNGNVSVPDLEIREILHNCDSEGRISFSFEVVNSGLATANSVPVNVYDENGAAVYSVNVDLGAGESRKFSFKTGAVEKNVDLMFRFVADEAAVVCESDGNNNEKSVIARCTEYGSKGDLRVNLSCPSGQPQGGLFTFEISIENTGTMDIDGFEFNSEIPDGFTYVKGTSVRDGAVIADPVSDIPVLKWKLDKISGSSVSTIRFSVVADADLKPDRYCVSAFTLFAPSAGLEKKSDVSRCCTVVVRKKGEGCCIRVTEFPGGFFHRPDSPVSFIEPKFNTSNTMYSVYGALKLWKNRLPLNGSRAEFMRKRLINYSLSSAEEFYFRSGMGHRNDDGSLKLSYAEVWPENSENGEGWKSEKAIRRVSPSQIGFELLGLGEILRSKKGINIEKYKRLIENRVEFIRTNIDSLPEAWSLKDKDSVEKLNGEATLKDLVVLYYGISGLKGEFNTAEMSSILRKKIEILDNYYFNRINISEELLFMRALFDGGEDKKALNKARELIKLLKEEDGLSNLKTLHDFALAAAFVKPVDSEFYKVIISEMDKRFYLKDAGFYANKQPDLTYDLKLEDMAAIFFLFDRGDRREDHATVLYRTFDEAGMFLKKRNLSAGKPLFSMIRNYSFGKDLLPVLTFTKASKNIAGVFTNRCTVISTLLKPMSENLVPGGYTKLVSSSSESSVKDIARLSFELQVLGMRLIKSENIVVSEEGRSLLETGRKYLEAVLKGSGGVKSEGISLIPGEKMLVAGRRSSGSGYEASDAGTEMSTETLSWLMLAEKEYLKTSGPLNGDVRRAFEYKTAVLEQFRSEKLVPEKFSINRSSLKASVVFSSSTERCSAVTAARFYSVSEGKLQKFLGKSFKKGSDSISAEDIFFLHYENTFAEKLRTGVESFIDKNRDSSIGNAMKILAGGYGGDIVAQLEKSWDKEILMPLPLAVDNIDKGQMLTYRPGQLIYYIAALEKKRSFRFERVLNVFTHLLENEWGMELNEEYLRLPSDSYKVIVQNKKEILEPGDRFNVQVTVDNRCPENVRGNLSSLFVKAEFNKELIYGGSVMPDGMEDLGDFRWRYGSLYDDSVLRFIYQAVIPEQFMDESISGTIRAGGNTGSFGAFTDNEKSFNCEDFGGFGGLRIEPFTKLKGLVFEDRNMNGTREPGEDGIEGILFKDGRGRVFRSDADGHFDIIAGEELEPVQLDLKSVPEGYMLRTEPTWYVNRNYKGKLWFPIVPCRDLKGKIWTDKNGNGKFDEGEGVASVVVKAGEKEAVTDAEGNFTLKNLPLLWKDRVEISESQKFKTGSSNSLKLIIK